MSEKQFFQLFLFFGVKNGEEFLKGVSKINQCQSDALFEKFN